MYPRTEFSWRVSAPRASIAAWMILPSRFRRSSTFLMEAMLTMTTAASPMDMATTSEKATMIFVEMRMSLSFT